jgi:hypothetical protein
VEAALLYLHPAPTNYRMVTIPMKRIIGPMFTVGFQCWSRTVRTGNDPFLPTLKIDTADSIGFIAILQYQDGPLYLLKLNPSDSRGIPHWLVSADPLNSPFIRSILSSDKTGYRALVLLRAPVCDDIKMQQAAISSLFSRPYTLIEKMGLNASMTALAHVYEQIDLIPQLQVLGNNAHQWIPDKPTVDTKQVEPVVPSLIATAETNTNTTNNSDNYVNNSSSSSSSSSMTSSGGGGRVICGNEHEPLLCHGHIIGRGDPLHEYIVGVPLGGPLPGHIFNVRGKHGQTKEAGTLWTSVTATKVATRLAIGIRDLSIHLKRFGLNLVQLRSDV